MIVLAVLALLISLAALGLAALPYLRRRKPEPPGPAVVAELPDDVLGLRQEVAALRLDSADSLRHLSIVRYDAFGDVGGKLSWSLALLDDHANGILLTAIHGRTDTRSYAKSVVAGECEQALSPEEEQALRGATR